VRPHDAHDPFDQKAIDAMRSDKTVLEAVRTFIGKTFEYKYYRNFTWLGRPIIQYPQDIVALQELIWSYRPTLVIETGVAHGGGLILCASILELIGGRGDVLGVEIEFREHNRRAVSEHPLAKRITVIEGSSIAPDVIGEVHRRSADHERVMLVLDSHHTHEHVLAELRAYSPLIRKDGPLVVFGTSVAYLDSSVNLGREWTQRRNPKTALDEFLRENARFEIDHQINDKLLITDAPGGYLRCIRD
jgi:cephalosporin hydroxylase